MKTGDVVAVKVFNKLKYGIIVKPERKAFMVGPVVEVMIEGEIVTCKKENIKPVGE